MISFIDGSAIFESGASNTISAPTTFNVANGDTIVVGIRTSLSNTAILSVTDTAGNVYQQRGQVFLATSSSFEVWVAENCIAHATNTVTATYSVSTTFRGINVTQWRELAAFSSLENIVKTFITANDITSPAFSTQVANSVIIALSEINVTGATWTPDTGFTLAVQDSDHVIFAQYKIVSATQSSVTVTASSNNATIKAIIVITLHETISGGGGQSSVVLRGASTIPYKSNYY
jgi:hypothetical protein